jgi:hypothetical protein
MATSCDCRVKNEVLMALETVAFNILSHVLKWYTVEEDCGCG